ncbi:ZYRO0G14146p [Zygosaccharomyces rouxii]|uniref:Transcription initiation factor TFIID subunit 8 n=1 Tax=Zygosaccharomyces rouxii (strain ATCC 2623 / CBS 732 / NBRC 1130 / NCYC 568 / NRRL Y-229) TaxID=559307 RepID=C5E0N0_ZYGRC|nr:uncharacterized protein ZYRO0G14146g [Zygosaccharomyces rouxii]KAH9202658.1 hypothetical protein LQ764DRAFT_36290 [Zygosaccharomyces rouxii]CAR29664.1 ZYRO0G14146p [Zygosaccharomyces rouxii]
MDNYIQITKLPTLQELQHEDREPNVVKVLAKSVALQLKPMNAQITQFAFDRLLQLVDGQLNDMISQLHRMSNLQRRETIAKGDISMLMEGFNISPSSIELQSRISEFYSQKYFKEFNHLHSLRDLQSSLAHEMVPFEDQEAVRQNVSTVLVPPTNPLQDFLPKWLPDFPPDHTYKFTPQYSHPITDETTIRRQIVEEAKQSELALSHLSQKKNPTDDIVNRSQYDSELAEQETLAIYGSQLKKRKTQHPQANSADLLSKLPQTNFSVEEYAHNRIEVARKKVLEFEERQLQSQQDPFLKLSRIAFTQCNDKFTKKQVHREFQLALQRSFIHLVKSIPELERNKLETEEKAKEERSKRLQELRAQREEQEKKGERDVLDLDELDQNQEDFFAMESSDEEVMEPTVDKPPLEQPQQTETAQNEPQQPELIQEHVQEKSQHEQEQEQEQVQEPERIGEEIQPATQEIADLPPQEPQGEPLQGRPQEEDISIELSSNPSEDEDLNNSTYPV